MHSLGRTSLVSVGAAALFSGATGAMSTPTPTDQVSEWLPMPGGIEIHESCIHRHHGTFSVAPATDGTNTMIVTDEHDADVRYPPCEHKPRPRSRRRGHPGTERLNHHLHDDGLGPDQNYGYYSDWSVYAQSTIDDARQFGSFSAEFIVPEEPTSRGPLGLSSVYFFPGLEDGGGHHGNASLILQPVLQFGKSGCVIDPVEWGSWHYMSYLVTGDGRAHCGEKLSVSTGDALRGEMIQDPTSGKWTVNSVVLATNKTSTYTTALTGSPKIDAAYITMEGMIIYGCDAYPPGGSVNFTSLSATDALSSAATLSWTKEIRHSECGQDVNASDDGTSVTLIFNN